MSAVASDPLRTAPFKPLIAAEAADSITLSAEDETDSEYEATLCSETTSLTDSVLDYVHENGRRYVSDRWNKDYLIPNDDREQERMDVIHHMFLHLLGGDLFLAPLDFGEDGGPKKRALDLGTGTGIWAIEFADNYPNWDVLGTDISPIQPSFVPGNCRFELDDFEQEWTFRQDEMFDYIHIRYLVGTVKNWETLLEKCFEHIKPGGYIEIGELDITHPSWQKDGLPGKKIQEYTEHLGKAAEKVGARMDLTPTLSGILKEVGFKDVKDKVFLVPIGTWPKDPSYKNLGKIARVVASEGTEAMAIAFFTRILDMDAGEATQLCKDASKEYSDNRIHTVYNLHIMYAQKPLEDS